MKQQVAILPDNLQQIRDLYERGLYLQAFEASKQLGPLAQWQGTAARIMAARLASHLGAVRLGNWLTRCAWKDDPSDPEASYYFAFRIYGSRGPYATWRWMSQRPEFPPETSDDLRAAWCALAGDVLAALRDFDAAELWFKRAEQVDPGNAWVGVSRSRCLELQDRYDEALQAAHKSLDSRPWYRPAVQAVAHLLTLSDRDPDALQLLNESMQRLESSAVAAQLFALQLELRQYSQASTTLDRIEELWPLLEKHGRQWLAAQRAEVAYHLGDIDGAIQFADQSDNEFFKLIASNLKQPERATKPVLLPVGFVRQHHVTCGPATLSAISRYWAMPADHLQVAEEICYDGTPAHSERLWAQQNGWCVREFTVTESSAAELIQRGVPFTLTTVEPGNSHLQAVIGYDGRRGVLVIRDPYYRTATEALAEKTLERYRAYGPRGMALVPTAEQSRLESVDLPDAPLWDAIYQLDSALMGHRREDAQRVLEQLQAQWPQHQLTFEARRRLAGYDNNLQERINAVEQLFQMFPENQCLILERMGLMRDVTRRDERLKQYAELCRRKDAHPLFWQQYAQELRMDARQHDEAMWLLQRAIRRWSSHATNYYILGNIYWDRRRFEEALELYRFAACLDDKDEQFVRAYFLAAKWFKRTDEVLQLLRNRFASFGRKSNWPARTLFTALSQLDRTTEALQVLEQAIEKRPGDGQLQLFAADGYLSCGLHHLPRAQELLEQARDRAPRGEWLRTAARITSADGRLAEALELWESVLELEPLSIDAHRAAAQLWAETKGRAFTLEHLSIQAERYPHFTPLHELWVEWTREEPSDLREPVIRWVVEKNPENAWARRELAFLLGDMRRLPEAWQQADEAGRIDPDNAAQRVLRARLLRTEEKFEQAKQELRAAIAQSVDYDYAISESMDLCESLSQRREALAFVQQQLFEQVIFGDGLLTFREHARGVLDADELLAVLRGGLEARPDLWHGWSSMVQQLLSMNRLDEAWELACHATDRFPLLPRLWVDRAFVCRAREDWTGALEALETAYEINPGWGYAVRLLCDLHERNGDLREARRLMELAVSRSPLDAWNHVELADILWRDGERDAAIQRMYESVQIEPGNEGAWERLHRWSRELGQPERALEAVRELTVRRAGEGRSWMLLARALSDINETEESLKAVDQAIHLNPRNIDAHDLRASTLARAGRWEEALAACKPSIWPQQPPLELRGRAAWIEAEKGNVDTAIELMTAAVEEDPNYYFGWNRLADWHQQRGNAVEFLRAAEKMVQISPHYEVCLGYLGEARLANEDREGAREAFRRAFEMSPDYEFAGNSLFDMQIEDGDLNAAAGTLEVLQQQCPDSSYAVLHTVQLACRQSDTKRACDALKQLCSTHFDENCLNKAVLEMNNANLQHDAAWVLKEICDSSTSEQGVTDHNADIAREWVNLRIGDKYGDCQWQLHEWWNRGLDVSMAVYFYIHKTVEMKQWKALRHLFRASNHEWLKSTTLMWGGVGYGMAAARWYSRALDWLSDYKQRESVQPWMLVNLVEALWDFRNHELQACEVSRYALDLPDDNGKDGHRIWLASAAACRGNIFEAQAHLRSIDTTPEGAFQFQLVLTEAIIRMSQAAGTADAESVYQEVRSTLVEARKQFSDFHVERSRRRLYYRAIGLIVRYRGTLQARLWRWTQRLQ